MFLSNLAVKSAWSAASNEDFSIDSLDFLDFLFEKFQCLGIGDTAKLRIWVVTHIDKRLCRLFTNHAPLLLLPLFCPMIAFLFFMNGSLRLLFVLFRCFSQLLFEFSYRVWYLTDIVSEVEIAEETFLLFRDFRLFSTPFLNWLRRTGSCRWNCLGTYLCTSSVRCLFDAFLLCESRQRLLAEQRWVLLLLSNLVLIIHAVNSIAFLRDARDSSLPVFLGCCDLF